MLYYIVYLRKLEGFYLFFLIPSLRYIYHYLLVLSQQHF